MPKRISQIPDAGRLQNGDIIPIVRAGITQIITVDAAGIFAFEEGNTDDTDIITDGVYEHINCTLAQSGADNGFTVLNNTFTYTLAQAVRAVIQWHFTLIRAAASQNRVYAFKVHVNGNPVDGRCVVETSNELHAGSLVAVVDLSQNDVIELKVACIGDNDDVQVDEQTVLILARE